MRIYDKYTYTISGTFIYEFIRKSTDINLYKLEMPFGSFTTDEIIICKNNQFEYGRYNTTSTNLKLFRPLLDLEKKQLIYTAKKFFVKIFKDPSNLDTKYLRTKIRFLKKELEKNGIKSNQILKSINNLASTRDTLNNYLNQTIKKCFKKKNKKILVALKPLFLETKEIQLKALSKIIKTFSGSYYPPRSKKVINLINNIKLSQKNKFTLGGCIFEKDRNNMIITLEV